MNNLPNSKTLPTVDWIEAKIAELKARLNLVQSESVETLAAVSRILGQDVIAFRDSPAIDVSAMDGYAIRIDEHEGQAFPIVGTATAGSAPIELLPRTAVRVFTGGPVPAQADCVVRREDCNESETYVSICVPKESLQLGQSIRRQGENARAGSKVISQGSLLTPARYAGLVTFADLSSLQVFRKVRVGIINTGNELLDFGVPIQPWQIRDSNGPFLETTLAQHPWISVTRTKVSDDPDLTIAALQSSLVDNDVVLMTGGVSMGDTDYVPDAIRSSGCSVVFHRLAIRPGKPVLGAVGPSGQLVMGLPGNPLSVAVTFRRFAWPLIETIAGINKDSCEPTLKLETEDAKTLDLTWFRLVSVDESGALKLVSSQGSGDIASIIDSDGFAEIPPGSTASGLRRFFRW